MLRITQALNAALLLAAACLLGGCAAALFGGTSELKLYNKCPFPIVVAVTYESSLIKDVPLEVDGEKSVNKTQGDAADTITVKAHGQDLYMFSVPRQDTAVVCDLTPTGVSFKNE